jgi:hypothetical protein
MTEGIDNKDKGQRNNNLRPDIKSSIAMESAFRQISGHGFTRLYPINKRPKGVI